MVRQRLTWALVREHMETHKVDSYSMARLLGRKILSINPLSSHSTPPDLDTWRRMYALMPERADIITLIVLGSEEDLEAIEDAWEVGDWAACTSTED